MLSYNKSTGQITTQKVRKPAEDEIVWIRLLSPEKEEIRHVLHDLFECHPLLVEDCMKFKQRPKMDKYKNNFFIAFFAIDANYKPIEIAIIIGSNYVISITNKEIPVLEALYQELKEVEGKLSHPGEILYHIMDRCVDDYVNVINLIEDKVDVWENAIHRNPYVKVAQDLFRLKRITHELRRIFMEERTVLGTISHQHFPYTEKEADVYFVDIYDHISRIIDSIDMFRESLNGLIEMQMSLKADRMNEIMKILTIFSTLFMPITFIVGLYGMNFSFMPELHWTYGYVYVLILMALVVAVMFYYFKKKRWL